MSTSTNSASGNQPLFTDTESFGEEAVRPFRVSGLISLVLALVSGAALASSSLLVLPVMAILAGLIALRPAKDKALQPSGRALAVCGIGLALLFGSWSYAYFSMKRSFLTERSRQFAEDWLVVLRHELPQMAFELTLPAGSRQLSTMPLAEYYSPKNPPAYEQFDAFQTRPLAAAVINAKTDPEWEFTGVIGSYHQYISDYTVLRFEDKTGTIGPIQVTLSCSRGLDSEGNIAPGEPFQWHVSDFDILGR